MRRFRIWLPSQYLKIELLVYLILIQMMPSAPQLFAYYFVLKLIIPFVSVSLLMISPVLQKILPCTLCHQLNICSIISIVFFCTIK